MTTPMSYDGSVAGTTSYVTQMATMAVVAETDPAFLTILPQMIVYAELRMYRDLDFLFTSGVSTAYSLTAGSRVLNVPADTFDYGTLVVPEQINVLVLPAQFTASISLTTMSVISVASGTIEVGMMISGFGVSSGTIITGFETGSGGVGTYTISQSQIVSETLITGNKVSNNPDLATRVPLLPTTKEFLDAVYGSGAVANRGVPQYWVPFDDYTFLVGPYPDQAYTVELVGTYRPESLSATKKTTFISLNLPDIMIMASMVYISAYQRNFGRMNDDPQMAISYESQYQALLKGAMVEEARKKFEAAGWSSQSPSPIATPTRG